MELLPSCWKMGPEIACFLRLTWQPGCHLCALAVALGPRGAHHWSTWSLLIRQHSSPVIAVELMSFQWGDWETAAARAFVNIFIALHSFYLRASGFALGHLWIGTKWVDSNQLSLGFPKAPVIYLITFQEVVSFVGRLLHISCCWTGTVWWLRCSERQLASPPPRFSIMNPESWSVKFVILTALQALTVTLSVCDRMLLKSVKGKKGKEGVLPYVTREGILKVRA